MGNENLKPIAKELDLIEQELNAVWKLLSPSERQKRAVLQKMNRVRMTLHRLKYSGEYGISPISKMEY